MTIWHWLLLFHCATLPVSDRPDAVIGFVVVVPLALTFRLAPPSPTISSWPSASLISRIL